MIQKIKKIVISTVALLGLFAPLFLSTAPALAASCPAAAAGSADVCNAVCNGATNLNLTTPTTNTDCTKNAPDQTGGFQKILTEIINIFSIIVGVIAVIMIIFGGFKYITSGGKEEGVKGAKNTILYALIGLIIVALAQIIVKFVLSKATGA